MGRLDFLTVAFNDGAGPGAAAQNSDFPPNARHSVSLASPSAGKRIFDDLYIHLSAIGLLQDAEHRRRIEKALGAASGGKASPNVAKINQRTGCLSLLAYEDFESSLFPALLASWRFGPGAETQPVFRSYAESLNPPILHRKELLVAPTHESHQRWVELTRTAEELGLFEDTRAIGFRLNWEQHIAAKGYRLAGDAFLPLSNIDEPADPDSSVATEFDKVQRQLTALFRTGLSAPVQLLLRSGLLDRSKSFFDYGCGRGSDVAGLAANGYAAAGWDPHYAPGQPILESHVVNLGFVVNVIEDAAERVNTIRNAFALTRHVLAIGVMLYDGEARGKPFRDGFLTSRNTFQKYFSQAEFKDYVEHVLNHEAYMVAPGVCFVFADTDLEQQFIAGRYRRRGLAAHLLSLRSPLRTPPRVPRERIERPSRPPRIGRVDAFLEVARPILDALWATTLDLGRLPDPDETSNLAQVNDALGSLSRATRLLQRHYDTSLLTTAEQTRTDDLRLFFAMQQFGKRPSFRSLEPRLQRDVKAFFGDYRSAQAAGLQLLADAAKVATIRAACQEASQKGLGFLDDERALQLHISIVDRLPAALRAYVACGMVLYAAASDVQLIRIHIESGKLTLLEYDGFDTTPLPALAKRIKVNIRKQDYDVFEYGSLQYPKPLLYWKSRYLHEDMPGYAEQLQFDEELEAAHLWEDDVPGPSLHRLQQLLEDKRLSLDGFRLTRSQSIPDLDQRCGVTFTYRSFIECGETQGRLRLKNIPLRAESYNALRDLATHVLDPVIEYFGPIRLTYGFGSAELTRNIAGRIAPKLDQHAACEIGRNGSPVCARGGAACDFIVDDEDMREVADWIIANVAFDRLYFYGAKRSIHVSYGPENSRAAYEMTATRGGSLVPRPYRRAKSNAGDQPRR